VVQDAPASFVVLYIKTEGPGAQRKDATVPGMTARYTLPRVSRHEKSVQQSSVIDGMDLIQGRGCSMILLEVIDEHTAIDVLATCRDMPAATLAFLRLQARMKKPAELSPFERAITSGQKDLDQLLAGHDEKGEWIYLKSDQFHKLSSYGNTNYGQSYHFFDSMPIKCQYAVANGRGGTEWVASSIHELITTTLHEERMILIGGPAKSGKTQLGKGLAAELVKLRNNEVAVLGVIAVLAVLACLLCLMYLLYLLYLLYSYTYCKYCIVHFRTRGG